MKSQLLSVLLFTLLLSVNSALAANTSVQLPETGQVKCYNAAGALIVCTGSGQDGDIKAGVQWPSPRFIDNGNGTVTDNLTGLVWLKDADCFATQNWQAALASANGLASGACGLSDGSAAGNWRLPNKLELFSLVDLSRSNPSLPANSFFTNVQPAEYWSSTTVAGNAATAWEVNMSYGYMVYPLFTPPGFNPGKDQAYHLWPVRAAQ